jgi:hypothetical protein
MSSARVVLCTLCLAVKNAALPSAACPARAIEYQAANWFANSDPCTAKYSNSTVEIKYVIFRATA